MKKASVKHLREVAKFLKSNWMSVDAAHVEDAIKELQTHRKQNPSPGATTTPVEKRVEDVATDAYSQVWEARNAWRNRGKDVYAGAHLIIADVDDYFAERIVADHNKHLAEPQPISNPLVCGRCATFQEAALDLVKAWRSKEASHIESCVYKICATQLAALLEGKS